MPPLVQRLIKKMLSFWSFGVVCRLSSPWFSEIPAANSRHNLRLPRRAGIGKKALENGCTFVAADLSFSQQKQDGPPMPGTNGIKFGIQASFCSTDETWIIPF